ncbi:MAG TPA: hypothetical protein VE987_15765 [Polyangiaceae bacterium]|nr:hypothetical protein [Polyangiaceae bacterium]
MPTLRLREDALVEHERAVEETSDERFDRVEFARRALDVMGTPQTTVAVCGGATRLRVASGRWWGRSSPDARWAMLSVPPTASRRAIVLAAAELARVPRAYALEVLLREAGHP